MLAFEKFAWKHAHRNSKNIPLIGLCVGVLVCVSVWPGILLGQRAEPLPEELEGVGITEALDAQLPLDAKFIDDAGREITFGQYFDSGRPVILNLGYYGCPMLCGLVTNGLMDALAGMDWTPGQEFEIVTLSFDPKESQTLASLKKHNYIQQLGQPEAAAGWHFLIGQETDIKQVTDAAGFYYKWNEKRGEFSHAAALIICTPEGHVSRYLYGIMFDPQTLRLSLVEAAEGKVGSTMDKILLFCFHYDSTAGKYAPAARNLMKAGGFLTVLIMGGVLTGFWRRERRRKRQAA
jgi:protein SCO1/2